MPPHRVAAVLRTLAPNSIPRLSPPRARLTPNFLPGPLSRSSLPLPPPPPPPSPPPPPLPPPRAFSHSAHAARFSTKLSRRASGHADPPLPLYHRLHHHQRPRSYYYYSIPVAITFGASTFTSSKPDDVLPTARLRRTSLFFPDSTPIPLPPPSPLPPTPYPLPLPPFPPFISILPFARAACHPSLRIYPARFLLRFSFKFHPTFSTQPHRSSRRRCYRDIRCIYISRARLLLSSCHIPSLFLSPTRF